jgi:hypothetical protein
MKRSLLIAFVLLFGTNIVTSQPLGSIGLFADEGASSCSVYDIIPAFVITIYVVHVHTPGAAGAQFMVDHWSWGANLTVLVETVTPPYIHVGNSETGISIGYGGMCVPAPNMILTISYLGSGQSLPCSYILVMPAPTAGPPGIYVTDCATPPNLLNATGGALLVNPMLDCNCSIPVEETTWGRVKALYQ